jgi:hypothetical protein
MPEVDSYKFSHKELLELLIREAGVNEGEWMLRVSFGLSAGNFGPDDEHINPGAIVLINDVGITRATPNSPRALMMDASKIKPSST